MTSTTLGWVLVDGRADAGPTVSGNEFEIPGDCGASNVSGSSAAAAAAMDVVTRVQAMLAGRGERLRGIGVTWSGDATAASALLLESLAGAHADNVVPVRFSRAAASLAGEAGDGSGRTAVCVVEPALVTLVVFEGDGDPVVTERAITGGDDVTGWLTDLLGSGGRRPAMLMLAGSGAGLDKLGRRLETRLSVPVFVQAGAPLALARGAALALGAHADLGGVPWEELGSEMDPAPARSASYAGGLAMLAGGAVAFVVSLSAALSLQWGPREDVPQLDHVSVARVAVPAPIEAPAAPPAEVSAPPAELPARPPAETPDQAPAEMPDQGPVLPESRAPFGGLQDAPPPVSNRALVPGPAPQPSGPRSLLDRVRQHVPHLAGH